MSTAVEVSGRALLGVLQALKAHEPDALHRVLAATTPDTRSLLQERVRQLGFYPYAAYADLLRAAEQVLGSAGGSLSAELGRRSGKIDVGTILKVFIALSSPERLIRSCGRVWSSYYRNAGYMVPVEWSPDSTVLRIHGFPTMSREHCRLMEGWMRSTMEVIGARVAADGRETACMSEGAQYHEFRCRWSKR